jgi:uncharacterized protein YndB with AHSA1/START domain
MNKTNFTISDDKKSLVIERVFNSSQHNLWRAYTEKELFEQWFAPQGWTVTTKKFDFANGGENIYVMKCEDKAQGEWYGQISAGKMVFSNINPEYSYDYEDFFTDEAGMVNESLPGSKSSVELSEQTHDSTLLRVTTSYATADALKQVIEMGMEEGYGQTLDKLEQVLQKL